MLEHGGYPWYGRALADRLRELGAGVHELREVTHFHRDSRVRALAIRAQLSCRLGPAVHAFNRAVLRAAEQARCDIAFLWRGDLVLPATLRALRAAGVRVVGYNNDDPFAPERARAWRHLRAGLPIYDLYFAYRHRNLEQLRAAGCPRVALLRSWYVRELHHPVLVPPDSPLRCDASFIGHWEPDGREKYLHAVLDDPSIRLRVHGGPYWRRARGFARIEAACGPVRPVYGEAYAAAIAASKISLVFLSRLNGDTYTRRCFEIPAIGTFMLSEYTDDLAGLFREGVEAEYFRSPAELVDKLRFYLRDDTARERIAMAGRARLLADGHEVGDRARTVLSLLEEMRDTRAAASTGVA